MNNEQIIATLEIDGVYVISKSGSRMGDRAATSYEVRILKAGKCVSHRPNTDYVVYERVDGTGKGALTPKQFAAVAKKK